MNTLPLRDIHLPPEISWWPPAPGWWLIVSLLLLLLGLSLLWRRYRNRRRLRREALKALREIERRFHQNSDKQQLLSAISTLLRRLAISHEPGSNRAGVIGEAWLRYLDHAADDRPFSRGAGEVLATGPYQAKCVYDAKKVLRVVRKAIRKWPLPKRGVR
ncbi:MAG: DUF4381 domain-containing protein [Gammaproteobacteria bacterium]|nr:DUF4381 domain-containing protein [Gammaproteobacteria bacterium]